MTGFYMKSEKTAKSGEEPQEGGESMRYTAIYKPKGYPVIYETFPCRCLQSARWYAQARAKRYGWELVGVVME